MRGEQALVVKYFGFEYVQNDSSIFLVFHQFVRTEVKNDGLFDLAVYPGRLYERVLIEGFAGFAALFFYLSDKHSGEGK